MVTKKSGKPLKIVTMRLYEEDIALMKIAFPRFGYNVIVREKVHKMCKDIQAKIDQKLSEQKPIEGDDLDTDFGTDDFDGSVDDE